MANVNTDIVTNFVAVPQVKNSSQQLHGAKRIAQGTIALAAGDLSASDTVMLAPIPTNASISSIKLFNDDLDSGTTMTTDVGLWTTAIAVVHKPTSVVIVVPESKSSLNNLIEEILALVGIGANITVSLADRSPAAKAIVPCAILFAPCNCCELFLT